jgi:aspartyl-tRNA(Asn)/glutamyl-tRNA(Gln) amidotransferase subunit A
MQIKQGKYRGPLHGIPVCLKDLIYMKGVRSTSGSKILSDFVPDYDSTVVKKLKDAGAIIVGMNNTHEFACGITNINPHYGSSKNPWDINRMSGGSSGGSAVAVSAGRHHLQSEQIQAVLYVFHLHFVVVLASNQHMEE